MSPCASGLRDATGLLCTVTDNVDSALIRAGKHLRAVSTVAVGTDNIDLDTCTARGIPVGYTPDVLTETVADMGIGLLLAVARRIVEGTDYVRGGQWLRF